MIWIYWMHIWYAKGWKATMNSQECRAVVIIRSARIILCLERLSGLYLCIIHLDSYSFILSQNCLLQTCPNSMKNMFSIVWMLNLWSWEALQGVCASPSLYQQVLANHAWWLQCYLNPVPSVRQLFFFTININ